MNSFESRLAAALGMMAGKTLLAAVSGGADSTAMLAGLASLRKEAGFNLYCIHVEHGIRPAEESQGDERAVEALCEKLEVPCRVVSIKPGRIAAFAANGGPGIEGAARFFRLRACNREAKRIGADWILTAHTGDDLLETLLMRILKGAGPAGLGPMPARRGRMLRPLLGVTRQQVLAYLEERGISYRTDSTNTDIKFLRNRIRLKLVPLLDSSFPSWRKTLLAFAETQALAANFLAEEVLKRLPWDISEEGQLRLNEDGFFKAPLILREEAVFAGVDILTDGFLASTGPGRKKIVSVPRRSAVRKAVMQGTGDLGQVRLNKKNGFITMELRNKGERGFSLLIKEPSLYTLKGRVLGLGKNLNLVIRPVKAAGLSPAQNGNVFSAGLPLVLRNYREGDRILRGGHRRRVSGILNPGARPECTKIITVCDAEGTAAFIVLGREMGRNPCESIFVITRDNSSDSSAVFFEVSREAKLGGLDV